MPVFLKTMGDARDDAARSGNRARPGEARADSPCLEVETYTWDVLPPEYRTTEMSEAIARELAWTRTRMEA